MHFPLSPSRAKTARVNQRCVYLTGFFLSKNGGRKSYSRRSKSKSKNGKSKSKSYHGYGGYRNNKSKSRHTKTYSGYKYGGYKSTKYGYKSGGKSTKTSCPKCPPEKHCPKPRDCPICPPEASCSSFQCFPFERSNNPAPCGGLGRDQCTVEDCCVLPPICTTSTATMDFFEPLNTSPTTDCYTDPSRTPKSGHGFFTVEPLDDPNVGHTSQFHFVVEGDDRNEIRIDVTGGRSTISYVVGLEQSRNAPCFIVNIEAFGYHGFQQGMNPMLDGKIPDPVGEPNVCWTEDILPTWRYFDSWRGTVAGIPGTACAAFRETTFKQFDDNLQIGDAASILGDGEDMGISGWFVVEDNQVGPGPFVARPGSRGDINIDLVELCLIP
ncbi:unnamed protein product [Chrysoparadoxa australica]